MMEMNKLWKYKKIGDICVVERGGSPRPIDKFITNDKDGINWIKIGDTSDSMYITETAQKIIPEGMKKSRYVKAGDFLLSNSMSFGRPYILKIDGCIHDGWLVLRDEQELFDKRFLYYYLSSKTTYEKFKSMAVGGVVNNLNREMVRKVEVPVPDKEEQTEVADLLDKLKRILDSRNEELQLLDDLIKARFVEMFGDPRSNPFGFDNRMLKDTCKIVTGNTPSRAVPEYYGNYVEWIKTDNIVSGLLNPTKATECLSEKGMEAGRIVERDSILMACIAGSIASIGRVCVTDRTVAFNQQINAVVPEKYNVLFLYVLLQVSKDYLVEDVNMALKGILSKSKLEEKKFIVPPIGLQNQFADFVHQVDKSKVVVQKALDETQILFNSLMQQYFG